MTEYQERRQFAHMLRGLWGLLRRGFSRYITPISIVVAVVGLASFTFIGPVRPVIFARSTPSPIGEASAGGEAAGLGAVGSSTEMSATGQLDRKLVPYTTIPDRPRDLVISYVVQPGDSIGGIASQFNLNRDTIYWGNLDTLGAENLNMIWVGMKLNILPVDGVYYKSDGVRTLNAIADEFEVDPWEIIISDYNELEGFTPADIPAWGMRIVIPGGAGPIAEWPSPIQQSVSSSGVVTRGFMLNMPGACGPVSVANLGTGLWVPPVGGYVVTERFSGFHSGIDLAYTIGTPIYAADTGTVIFAGWNTWGYGNLVVLDHGNGWTSYYGHLSTWAVTCGQVVTRGQYIGGMGSTGNSTGSHLHYEMRWGHIPQNPSPFINIW